ncbi:MAG: elongation factor P [candidate division Zixibacteria bacterium]|nr:elongation factor P [candidate division Zixibacteria bacterium]
MLSTSDIRKGLKLKIEGQPFIVVDFRHNKTGRGGAKIWTKLKNLKTGQVLERTYNSGESFEDPDFSERKMQYLYNDNDGYHFMDSENFEQVALNEEQVGEYKWYFRENIEYKIMFFEGLPINVDMPLSVVLKVIEAEPGVKGDSVSNLTKNSKVETGLNVKVPLFIKEGESIKIDTRTGEYIERA